MPITRKEKNIDFFRQALPTLDFSGKFVLLKVRKTTPLDTDNKPKNFLI